MAGLARCLFVALLTAVSCLAACRTVGGSALLGGGSGGLPGVCTDPAAPLNTPLPCQKSAGQVRTALDAGPVDNGDWFTAPFYQKFALRHAASPLPLTAGIDRDYCFPTFYGDVTTAVVLLAADYGAAQALLAALPGITLHPTMIAPGKALAVITSYRYNTVYGIPGYNEVAISLPAQSGDKAAGGPQPVYVVAMPVTSHENNLRGHLLWGLPKVEEQIELAVVPGAGGQPDLYVTTVHEPSGEPYLKFAVPTAATQTQLDQSTTVLSVKDGATLSSPSVASGLFQVNKSPGALLTGGERPPLVWLGDTPSAAALKPLNLFTAPLETRFAVAAASAFDLPTGTALGAPCN